jgi:hypothetical protein
VHIVHAYGSLGRLPWQGPGGPVVEFGGKEGIDLPTVASRIRTYHEEIADLDRQAEIERLVAEAERMVFLGFAFHDQNIALLKPDKPRDSRNIYATTKGFEIADQDDIQNMLQATFLYVKMLVLQPTGR